MIQLYCVVDEPEAALRACGDDAHPSFRLVGTSRLWCIARDCATASPPPDDCALVEHDIFIRRMMDVSTVVPFRYGTVLPSVADAERVLAERADALGRQLREVGGRVELALRARIEAEPSRHYDGTGRAYLRMLRQESTSAAAEELHRVLAARAHRSMASWDRRWGLKASYLIGAGEVEGFRQVLSDALEGVRDLKDVSLTGPWAPYSFVGEDEEPVVSTAKAGGCDA